MIGQHSRTRIWHALQHPFKHPFSEFSFFHPAMPGVTNPESALNWLIAAFYPNCKDAVDTVGDLPTIGNSLLDYRVVLDDGDGRSSSYRFEQREGDAAGKWYKILDMDWGFDGVLGRLLGSTDDRYVFRSGYCEFDSLGVPVGGDLAGQTIFGGSAAGTHLTLFANSGDGVGADTGFVQFGDQVRPLVDSAISLGTTGYRFLKVWTDELTVGTTSLAAAVFSDTSGAISFSDENLTTTGWIKAGTATLSGGGIADTSGAFSFNALNLSTTGAMGAQSFTATVAVSSFKSGTTIGTLTLADGSITCSGGTIDFSNENLTSTGILTGGSVVIDNLTIDGNTIISTDTNGNITLDPNGTGHIALSGPVDVTGNLAITDATCTISGTGALLNVDNLRLDGNTLSSTDTDGNVIVDPNGNGLVELGAGCFPTTDSALDLGKTGNVWNKLWIDGSIGYGTSEILISTLMSLSEIATGAAQGMSLFMNGAGKWVASAPDTEIDHGAVTGLGDDDHTQYVLLGGRSNGQTIIGGTAAGEDLTLQSTSNAARGAVVFVDTLRPLADGVVDIGGEFNCINDLFQYGQLRGSRLENFTTVGRPAADVATRGRVIWDTTLEDIVVDGGGYWVSKSVDRWQVQDASSWNGTAKTVTYTVDGSDTPARGRVSDARLCIWALKDNNNGFKQILCDISSADASHVTVTVDVALPAATYTLIGIG